MRVVLDFFVLQTIEFTSFFVQVQAVCLFALFAFKKVVAVLSGSEGSFKGSSVELKPFSGFDALSSFNFVREIDVATVGNPFRAVEGVGFINYEFSDVSIFS